MTTANWRIGAQELLDELKEGRAAKDMIFYRMPFTMVDQLIETLSAALSEGKTGEA